MVPASGLLPLLSNPTDHVLTTVSRPQSFDLVLFINLTPV